MAARAERILTTRELNRALLARQHLLERATGPLPRTLERIGGIQAQYAPSMYVGLWTRVGGLARDDVTRALERRSIVQGTLMRATIHLVSARDYRALASGLRRARARWAAGVPSNAPAAEALRRLQARLAEGPVRHGEVVELVGRESATTAIMMLELVRVPPSGTWERRRADLFAAAGGWLGPGDADPAQGAALLARRYLQGFGPAAPAEIANWAGVTVGELRPGLERLALRRFRSESGGELVDLQRAPLPEAETPAPVRFLPTWDATLLVHARRTGLLPEEYRPRVFSTKTPHSVGTFLVDGAVAGTWRHDRGRVVTESFARLDAATRRELADEAQRLAAFHG